MRISRAYVAFQQGRNVLKECMHLLGCGPKEHEIWNFRIFSSTTKVFQNGGKASKSFKDPFVHFPQVHTPTPEEAAQLSRKNALTAGVMLAGVGLLYYKVMEKQETSIEDIQHQTEPVVDEHLVNWSGTHECVVKTLYQPESTEQVEAIIRRIQKNASEKKTEDSASMNVGPKVRCVGSALSPNGIAFQEEGMISLALMDKVVSVDTRNCTVTVQAGARVQDVADALRPYGMTLQNYASIREQTIGGFIQVGAHGTGAAIPPVDDTVVRMTLVTPGKGTIALSASENPELFKLAKVGLGSLGVVTEVTLQCVPAHKLVEKTFVTSRSQVKDNHEKWLRENKHLRYMWLPSTDIVVVVQCNPAGSTAADIALAERRDTDTKSSRNSDNALRSLLRSSKVIPEEEARGLSPTECRDALLAHDPLNARWVAKVNQAEATFWKANEGIRTGWSDEILGFDCGGEQWVYEVAFPCGTQESPDGNDIKYMEELLNLIDRYNIPAPCPIEQRWSCGSSSYMSPSAGPKESLFSWVGIIMYLPDSKHEAKRSAVTERFIDYRKMVENHLLSKYGAVEHWAKIEIPENKRALRDTKKRLNAKYPVGKFQYARNMLDPNNILSNQLIDILFE